MKGENKTRAQLVKEVMVLQQRVATLEAAEAERKRMEDRLRYHADVLANVSDAIITTDLQFHVLSWNKAAEEIYGWQADEVLGNPFGELVRPEYPFVSRDEVIRTFFAEGSWKGEVVHHRKDGTPIYILGSVSLLKDAEGKPIGAISANRDVTDRKRAEEKIRRLHAIRLPCKHTRLINSCEMIFSLDKHIISRRFLQKVCFSLPQQGVA